LEASGDPPAIVKLGEFTLDRKDERVWAESGPLKVGHKAFQVLSRLVEEDGNLVTKDELFSSVWDGMAVSESALTSVVKELRRALDDDPKKPRFIQSVYGRGYRLVEPTFVQDERGAALGEEGERRTEPRNSARVQSYPPLLHVPLIPGEPSRGDPWLDDVIREEVLYALSRFRDYRLVSGTIAGANEGASGSFGPRDYRLELRLLRGEGIVSLFSKLVRLETGEIIWSDRGKINSAKPGQDIDRQVRTIASAVLSHLHDDVTRNLPATPADAYGIYLHNQMEMRAAGSLEEMQAVAKEWEKLVEAHPEFVRAFAPLIYLLNTDFGYTGLGATTSEHRDRASQLANTAVVLDPAEPFLHTVSAWCQLWAGEADLARDHLEQAYDLNPFHRKRLLEIGTAWMFMGDLDRAAELLARCESLTPFVTEAPHEEAGLLHLLLGHYEKAEECLRRIGRPTVSSELYRLLAAGAAGAKDFNARAGKWELQVTERWRGEESPDTDGIIQWALFHHPFQKKEQREWVGELLRAGASDRG